MATLLDGKLYVKTFSMLYVDCNCHVIIKKNTIEVVENDFEKIFSEHRDNIIVT